MLIWMDKTGTIVRSLSLNAFLGGLIFWGEGGGGGAHHWRELVLQKWFGFHLEGVLRLKMLCQNECGNVMKMAN